MLKVEVKNLVGWRLRAEESRNRGKVRKEGTPDAKTQLLQRSVTVENEPGGHERGWTGPWENRKVANPTAGPDARQKHYSRHECQK